MRNLIEHCGRVLALSLPVLSLGLGEARAAIEGLSGRDFVLTAKADYISTADGQSLLAWGYAAPDRPMQYPGPTLIVEQGDAVTVTLTNQLPVATSIVFPGQQGVTAQGGTGGRLTHEAGPGATCESSACTVTYTFTAGEPGTYMYHSGTHPELQVEMGLVGALIVRPLGAVNQAYNHPDSAFDREYLFLLTEMDPAIHEQVEAGRLNPDTGNYFPVLWFINGRNAPDTMAASNLPWMPTQPYNSVPRAHPGEKVLLRIIGAGRDLHPFHTHGNNTLLIARDGRLLSSAPGAGADLATSNYTIAVAPGGTYDALFEWTGQGLGWDIYGHTETDPMEPHESAEDHGKPFPVVLPTQLELTNGPYWSGSPYLGTAGALPPGEGGYNPNAGYFFMWHSHTEKELTNHDIFPGGMMTMFIVEPAGVPIH